MAGLVPTIYVLAAAREGVDARIKSGHDDRRESVSVKGGPRTDTRGPAKTLFLARFCPSFLDSPPSPSIKHASAQALLGADCFCVGSQRRPENAEIRDFLEVAVNPYRLNKKPSRI